MYRTRKSFEYSLPKLCLKDLATSFIVALHWWKNCSHPRTCTSLGFFFIILNLQFAVGFSDFLFFYFWLSHRDKHSSSNNQSTVGFSDFYSGKLRFVLFRVSGVSVGCQHGGYPHLFRLLQPRARLYPLLLQHGKWVHFFKRAWWSWPFWSLLISLRRVPYKFIGKYSILKVKLFWNPNVLFFSITVFFFTKNHT